MKLKESKAIDANPKDVLKLATQAGEILLSNGAETNRVEDTMTRMMEAYGLKESETFVTPTGIFASAENESATPVSVVKRVKVRTMHLGKVALVNELSRNIVENKLDFGAAAEKLGEIKNVKPYSLPVRISSSGVTCFAFCYMFGGSFFDCINAFIIGLLIYVVFNILCVRHISNFLVNIICGALISVMTIALMGLGIGTNMDKIISGSIMPFVPGIGITNAVRDVLEGDFLSGTSRIMDAVIVAVSIATGVGVVIKIWFFIQGVL